MEKTRTCFKPGLGCWVVVWVVIATISLVLSYAIARSNGHISFFVPAISDTTSKNPEGAVFAQLFNTTALITLILIAIRYFQVKMINRQVDGGESSHLSQLNSLSIVFGIGGALGASLVANFKSVEDNDDAVGIVHVIGAVILFTSGAGYCWTQTVATHQLTKFSSESRPVFTVRLVISCVLTLSALIFFICEGLTYHSSLKHESSVQIVGNLFEWLAAWCFGLYALSFFKEFQNLSLRIQCIPRCGGKSSDALKYSTIPVSGIDENITDSD
ncbi:unnamed protein product [Porites lobata]|uniref:CWH43-like N-terminal domain-containing protein n=1 Tax=Porites lobata TaxID=104759 RepID=A0ABN8N5D8_9CNID|nr:unnamed protein product [Porites lobata]